MTPANDRVIIKRIEAEVKTDGGIYIPESQLVHTAYGKVVSVYPPYGIPNSKTCQVKPGYKVVTAKHAGIELGNDLFVIHENEIIAYECL